MAPGAAPSSGGLASKLRMTGERILRPHSPVTSTSQSARPEHLHNDGHVSLQKHLPMKIYFEFSQTRQWICQLCHIEYNIALSLLDLTGKVIQQIWLLDKYVSKTIYSYKSKRYVVAKYWHLKAQQRCPGQCSRLNLCWWLMSSLCNSCHTLCNCQSMQSTAIWTLHTFYKLPKNL